MSNVASLADKRAQQGVSRASEKISVEAAALTANKMKLTAERVRKLEGRAQGRRWVADTETKGLYVAVEASATAAKSYYVRGRIGKGRAAKRVDIRLAAVGDLKLNDARDAAARIMQQLRHGADPRRRSADETLTLAGLIAAYEENLQQRGVVRWKDTIGTLNRWLDKLKVRDAKTLEQLDYLNAITHAERTVGIPSADALRRAITGMLNYAAGPVKHLPYSVMAGYRKPKGTRAEKVARSKGKQPNLRDAVEFRAFWAATESAHTDMYRDFLRVLLLTGQRSIELAKLEWCDLDLEKGIWHARAETRKNGEPMDVPLGPLSLSILKAQTVGGVTDLVFPNKVGGVLDSQTSGARLKPIKAAMETSCGRGDVALHTLRRAYRTRLSEMEVPTDMAELMVGHKRSDLEERYDHDDRFGRRVEIQNAYEAWVKETVSAEG
ncbi:tyrosine-type recombinase/integrase [Sulfitobacter sp. SK012]|uniref:tyrosine-type recombinase/integrase n=1 Tax=Sulfitobacter sp. SK012 TaxID=1389005 RepID=UPI0013B41F9C|nr:tyrosine-type recombinase/integrase [Sulfitobacter sp. SK012]